jgi:hypothetical protein
VAEKDVVSGRNLSKSFFLSPAGIAIGKFVLAAVRTPLECSIHPVAARTDPLISQRINQHSFSSSALKLIAPVVLLLAPL